MSQESVREAVPDDLDALGDLWRELEATQRSFRKAFPAADADLRVRDAFGQAMQASDECVFVVEKGSRLVGMAHCKIVPATKLSDDRAVELGRVVVASDLRGHGHGRRLIEAAEAWGRERGAIVIRAGVFAGNEAAFAFWRQIGFNDFVSILSRPIDEAPIYSRS